MFFNYFDLLPGIVFCLVECPFDFISFCWNSVASFVYSTTERYFPNYSQSFLKLYSFRFKRFLQNFRCFFCLLNDRAILSELFSIISFDSNCQAFPFFPSSLFSSKITAYSMSIAKFWFWLLFLKVLCTFLLCCTIISLWSHIPKFHFGKSAHVLSKFSLSRVSFGSWLSNHCLYLTLC